MVFELVLCVKAQEILYEISILEEEVGELEQQVLSVYRHIFTRCFSHSLSNVGQKNGAQTELLIYDEVQHTQYQKPQLEHIKLQNVPGININKDSSVPIHPQLGDASSKSNEAMSLGNLPHSQNLVHYKVVYLHKRVFVRIKCLVLSRIIYMMLVLVDQS